MGLKNNFSPRERDPQATHKLVRKFLYSFFLIYLMTFRGDSHGQDVEVHKESRETVVRKMWNGVGEG